MLTESRVFKIFQSDFFFNSVNLHLQFVPYLTKIAFTSRVSKNMQCCLTYRCLEKAPVQAEPQPKNSVSSDTNTVYKEKMFENLPAMKTVIVQTFFFFIKNIYKLICGKRVCLKTIKNQLPVHNNPLNITGMLENIEPK